MRSMVVYDEAMTPCSRYLYILTERLMALSSANPVAWKDVMRDAGMR